MSTSEYPSEMKETSGETRSDSGSSIVREVLVALDGSALAEAVLPQAITYAGVNSGGLLLLRVANTPYIPMLALGGAPEIDANVIEDMWQAELNEVRDYLQDVAHRLVPLDLSVRLEVLRGEPALAITTYLDENPKILAVAMATHGRTGLRGWVLGSVTDKVLRSSPRPLLIVRPAAQEDTMQFQAAPAPAPVYRTILVPLDGSPFAEQALDQARDLAERTGAELVLVTVMLGSDYYSDPSVETETWAVAERDEAQRLAAYLAATSERLRAAGLSVRAQLAHGYPPEEILRVGEQEGADLIVMATHGRGGLQRLWLGSVASKMVQASTLPILLIRPIEAVE